MGGVIFIHTPYYTPSEPFFPKTCSQKEAKASLDFRHIDSYNWANPASAVIAVVAAVGAAVPA